MRNNRTTGNIPRFTPLETLKKVDMFAAKLPMFNIEGKQAVSTSIGGLLSLIILSVTFMFAIMKIQDLLMRKNPNITTFVDPNAFTQADTFNTGEEGFQIAVALNNYGKDAVEQARYIKFVARKMIQNGDDWTVTYYPLHPCTDEDFAKFHPSEMRSTDAIDRYRNEGGMWCMDWQAAQIEVYGTWRVDSVYQAIDLMAVPCGM